MSFQNLDRSVRDQMSDEWHTLHLWACDRAENPLVRRVKDLLDEVHEEMKGVPKPRLRPLPPEDEHLTPSSGVSTNSHGAIWRARQRFG
jgi:hypothetical protein